MDVETAIQAFASAGNDLPREAMQWALDHWDEAASELLSVVERFASGADRSDETASAVFFILHLAGEKQDTRVFSLLCRLAQDVEALEAALGDTATIFKPRSCAASRRTLRPLKRRWVTPRPSSSRS
jgi:uncharacterized protein